MAHYDKILTIEGRVQNITQKAYNAYTSDGSILSLPPTPPPRFFDPDTYYIIDEGIECPSQKLLEVVNEGVGRDGVRVAMLFLKGNDKVRVYPIKGG